MERTDDLMCDVLAELRVIRLYLRVLANERVMTWGRKSLLHGDIYWRGAD